MKRKHRNGKNGYVGGNPRYAKHHGNFRGQRQVDKRKLQKEIS